MTRICVDGEELSKEQLSDTPRGQALLELAREHRQPISCLCRPDGRQLPLYTRRISDFLILCRMPKAGLEHHTDCWFYGETADYQGARVTVVDQHDAAIFEDEQGITHLNLSVALHSPKSKAGKQDRRTRSSRKPASAISRAAPKPTIDAQGLLRFLWHSARFNRWYPAMEGKRSWSTVAFHLQRVAQKMDVRGVRLGSRLLIIHSRLIQVAPLALFAQQHNLMPDHDIMMVVARVKSVLTDGPWTKMQLVGMREYLWCADEVWQRFRYEHRDALEVVNRDDGDNVIGLFGVTLNKKGYAHVRYASFFPVTEHYLPFLHPWEKKLMANLIEQTRAFTVRLSPRDISVGVALLDTDEKFLRLSILPPGGHAYPDSGSWRWDADQAVIPTLPRSRSNADTDRVVG